MEVCAKINDRRELDPVPWLGPFTRLGGMLGAIAYKRLTCVANTFRPESYTLHIITVSMCNFRFGVLHADAVYEIFNDICLGSRKILVDISQECCSVLGGVLENKFH